MTKEPASHLQTADGWHVGYWVGEPFWRNGFMTEAARALVSEIFSAMPILTIYSGIFDGNKGSMKVQEKLGFVVEGRTMMFSNPWDKELPHLNTVLTRENLEKNKR